MIETQEGFKLEAHDRRGEDLVTIANRIRKAQPTWTARQVMAQAKIEWQNQWNERNKK